MKPEDLSVDLSDPWSLELAAALRECFAAHLVAEEINVKSLVSDPMNRVLALILDGAVSEYELHRRILTLVAVSSEWARAACMGWAATMTEQLGSSWEPQEILTIVDDALSPRPDHNEGETQ